MPLSTENKPRYRVTAAKIIPALELWPARQDLADRHVMICTSDGDCPIRGVPNGKEIRTSLIVSGSIAEGFVETLNSVYLVRRTPDQVLRLAIDSGRYDLSAVCLFMCWALNDLKRDGEISEREWGETTAAVKALVQRYNDQSGTNWNALSSALNECDLPDSNADCLRVYEDYINELSSDYSEDKADA